MIVVGLLVVAAATLGFLSLAALVVMSLRFRATAIARGASASGDFRAGIGYPTLGTDRDPPPHRGPGLCAATR